MIVDVGGKTDDLHSSLITAKHFSQMVTHPVIDLLKQGLTSVNRLEQQLALSAWQNWTLRAVLNLDPAKIINRYY